jgi:hypothetical protein
LVRDGKERPLDGERERMGNVRRGVADAVTATPPMMPLRLVKERAAGSDMLLELYVVE